MPKTSTEFCHRESRRAMCRAVRWPRGSGRICLYSETFRHVAFQTHFHGFAFLCRL